MRKIPKEEVNNWQKFLIQTTNYQHKMSSSVLSEIDFMLSFLPVKTQVFAKNWCLVSTIESLVSGVVILIQYIVLICINSDLSWDSEHDYYIYSEKEDDDYDYGFNLPDCHKERVGDSQDCAKECVSN